MHFSDSHFILILMALTSLVCLEMERRTSWLAQKTSIRFSGVSLIILAALLMSGVGWIPSQHELYDLFLGPFVPLAIALLTFGLDLNHIRAIPRTVLFIFGVGALASIGGGIIAAVVGAQTLGHHAPQLAAQLAASFIGGNENAVAMKQLFGTPHELFVGSFTVDNLATCLWMCVTLFAAQSQPSQPKDEEKNSSQSLEGDSSVPTVVGVIASLLLGLVVMGLSEYCSKKLGYFQPLFYLMVISCALSQVKIIRNFIQPSYLLGTLLFIPFFFAVGAVSDLRALAQVPTMVLLMPWIVVLIHGVVIFTVARIFRVPSTETAIASQSLIGGAGSAIALAQAKNWKRGISLGMTLALLGYFIANTCGVIVYYTSNYLLSFGVIS